MNKLSKKFITGIIVILSASSLCSLLFNTSFLKRYYLYQKSKSITAIHKELLSLLDREVPSQTAVEQIESSYKVTIAQIENESVLDEDTVNQNIQSALQEKGIGFQKYWFWEEDYKKVLEGENRIRLYQQEKLNYSLLIDYIQKDSNLYAITMIVPNISDAFQIANHFLIAVNISTIMIAILFIILLIRKVTQPLCLFENFAKKMQENQFAPIELHTNDELESVADSLNSMGNQIIQFQRSLQEKNVQMEQLLDNVAHDLKTPVSLIQLYADGIKDGMDDGTFLDTILEENKQMTHMIDRLLYLSRIEKKQYHFSEVDLSHMIQNLIHKYSILAEESQMEIHSSIEKEIAVSGVPELLESLFLNLITNSVKYCTGKEIDVALWTEKNQILFTIKNETENHLLDIEKIWMPYYVGEESRNKKMSGTGLGLAIVYKICNIHHYSVQCLKNENEITFTVSMPI